MKELQRRSAEAVTEAEESLAAGKEASATMREHARALQPQVRKAVREVAHAKARLSSFRSGPLAAFEALREQLAAVPSALARSAPQVAMDGSNLLNAIPAHTKALLSLPNASIADTTTVDAVEMPTPLACLAPQAAMDETNRSEELPSHAKTVIEFSNASSVATTVVDVVDMPTPLAYSEAEATMDETNRPEELREQAKMLLAPPSVVAAEIATVDTLDMLTMEPGSSEVSGQ